MIDPIPITEVIDRSGQGTTKPFLCRGADGRLYYVKGRYAGLRSLCCEWVAGRLARETGLATPDIAMVELSDKLIDGSDRPDIRDLGKGLAFGSARVEGAREVMWDEIQDISSEIKTRILLFDWWVRNEDRSLSARGGNPNLLVTTEKAQQDDFPEFSYKWVPKLWTFDFNLAFDPDFQDDRFWRSHVFASDRLGWLKAFREQMEDKMENVLARLPEIRAELPLEWLHIDGDENLPMQLDLDAVMESLRRPFERPSEFWKEG